MSSVGWLYDGEHWKTARGEVLNIREMDPDHARNAKNLLLRKHRQIVRGLSFYMSMEAAMHDGGDMAQDALDGMAGDLMEREFDKSHKPCVDVVKKLPVFKALKRQSKHKVTTR